MHIYGWSLFTRADIAAFTIVVALKGLCCGGSLIVDVD